MSTPSSTISRNVRRRQRRRIARIASGAAITLVGVTTLAGGGALLGLHATQRDADGYYHSASQTMTTPSRALVSDSIDVGSDVPDWLLEHGRLGTVRVTATGSAEKPVFVGVAPAAAVERYLHGVDHDTVTDLELDPPSYAATRSTGTVEPAPPASQDFWAASVTGAGEESLAWQARSGSWEVVLMNADGSPHVATDVGVGARLGAVLWTGIGFALLGLGVMVIGLTLLLRTLRGPRRPSSRPVPAARPAAASGGGAPTPAVAGPAAGSIC